ncbi:MAG: hydroxyethylthiazole kinase [Candidatus Omnitrophica bacterium]|nr:hydroxyethylthiazole kinase [Candidatus Omnitrophota bacterium]
MKKARLNAFALLKLVRQQRPLVHHITNWVTIYDCAAIVKSFGASPVMAHAKEEVAQMAGIASSLVLNIGTLTPELVLSMKTAAQSAHKKGIPVVLDACGAGATTLRDQKVFALLKSGHIDILKGNASEVARIAGRRVRTRGVDAQTVDGDVAGLAAKLARSRKLTVVVTGRTDIVTDGKRRLFVKNGHPLMSKVVGTGCMAASVIGMFAAVEPDHVRAAASALACFGIAGECAARGSAGPGSFREKLFDCAYRLNEKTCLRAQKIEE